MTEYAATSAANTRRSEAETSRPRDLQTVQQRHLVEQVHESQRRRVRREFEGHAVNSRCVHYNYDR